jgi:hypothetical protein
MSELDYSGSYEAPTTYGTDAGYGSGLFQGLASLGLGYINRRIDIDLQQRAATEGSPQTRSNSRPVTNTGVNGGDGGMFGSNPAAWLIGAAVVAVLIFAAAKG